MQLVKATSFDEVISVYLKTELSGRFSSEIVTLLEQLTANRTIVDEPDVSSITENNIRRRILVGYRAYVFDELPEHVQWHHAFLTRDEVAKVRYIDYSYWNELSAYTRLPSVAAETIRSGRTVFGASNDAFLEVALALKAGAQFPELIVVAESPTAALTVYEGHLRLTAYMLASESLPDELPVLIGFAPECANV